MYVVITGGIIGVLIWATLTIKGTIMTARDNLIAAVHRQTTVTGSAVTLIQQIADRLRNADEDTDLQALADELDGDANNLAASVAANTVASGEAHPETGEPIGNDTTAPSGDAGSTATPNGTNTTAPAADEGDAED